MQAYPGAFAVLGIPLVAGRDFGPADVGRFTARGADTTASSPGAGGLAVAVINEALARQLFGGENAVAKRFDILGRRGERSPVEVVGVVRNARFTNLRDAAEPMFFLPFSQANTGRGQMTLIVQAMGDAAAVASAVRAEVEALDPRAPAFVVEPLADQVAASLARERLLTLLAVLFGLLSLALASIGIYGLLATVVAQRTGEVGLRMALGATPRNVLRLILGEALWLVGAGVLVGLPAALVSARWLSTFLFDVGVIDPATVLAVIAVLLGAAALAAYPPARRAARIDPLLAMRSD
jgi:hypothetical protein